jgi:hypothetical protein
MDFEQKGGCRHTCRELSIGRHAIASLAAPGMLVVVVPMQTISI